MKSILNYLSYLPKKMVGAMALIAILAMPFMQVFAADALIEGSMGVANQTNGDTEYKESVDASFDDEVIFQVYYHNRELEDSGRVAENLKIDVDLPTEAGQTQNVGVTIKGDNTNTVTDNVTVNLDRSDAKLQFMPGTVVWKHNQGTNDNPDIVTESISDDVVTKDGGAVIEDAEPCFNFDATVTFKARVIVPAVEVTKYVRVEGQSDWVRENTANPGDTLEYAIGYKNAGNAQQDNVIVRDSLPPRLDYVEGSTMLKNAKNDGEYKSVTSDNVINGGIDIGSYTPGSNAFVKFKAVIPEAEGLECGVTEFRNVGVVQPEGMNEFFNTTSTTVEKECEEQPQEPVFRCEDLTADRTSIKPGQDVTFTTDATAQNGAEITEYRYNFGDGSDVHVTDNAQVTHTYDEAGTFRADVTVVFTVDGEQQTDSEGCAVVIKAEEKPVTPPEQPEQPEELPDAGPAQTLMAVAGTGVLGQGVRMYVSSRKKLLGSLLNR